MPTIRPADLPPETNPSVNDRLILDRIGSQARSIEIYDLLSSDASKQALLVLLSDPDVATVVLQAAAPLLPTSLPPQPNRLWNQDGILSIS